MQLEQIEKIKEGLAKLEDGETYGTALAELTATLETTSKDADYYADKTKQLEEKVNEQQSLLQVKNTKLEELRKSNLDILQTLKSPTQNNRNQARYEEKDINDFLKFDRKRMK